MGHVVQRFGIHIGRGWIIAFLLLGAVLLGAYWIGPLRPLPAEIELRAVQDGELVEEISVRGEYLADEAVLRFAVPLVARNVGAREGRPRRVILSVPGRYTVVTPRGRIRGEVTAGVPLRRYVIDVADTRLVPGAPAQPLPGLEQFWLEPDLPRYYCTTRGDVIPEFIPAPHYAPETLSEVRIFYSVALLDSRERSTGLLTVRTAPDQLAVEPAAMPPVFPTVVADVEAQTPDLGRLRFAGTRTAWCGDPEQPRELYTAQWEGDGGARVYSIHVDGTARKRLYDLDGNGIVDLETWDLDGDGRFEAMREARFPVPDFLVPLPPRNPELLAPVTAPADPVWLAVFNDAGAGPLRFARHGPPPEPMVAVAPGDTLAADTLPPVPGVPGAPGAPGAPDAVVALGPLPPPDSAWLATFLDTRAGPFRFTRRPPAAVAGTPADTPAAPPTPARPVTPAPTPPPPVAADSPVAPPPPPVAPAPPPRRVPLGTPVPVPPDTTPP